MGLGVYLSFRVLNLPGSHDRWQLYLWVCGSRRSVRWRDILTLALCGCFPLWESAAVSTTGFLMTKLRIQPILAGILTMTALYSVNLRDPGRYGQIFPCLACETIFTDMQSLIGEDAASLVVDPGRSRFAGPGAVSVFAHAAGAQPAGDRQQTKRWSGHPASARTA